MHYAQSLLDIFMLCEAQEQQLRENFAERANQYVLNWTISVADESYSALQSLQGEYQLN